MRTAACSQVPNSTVLMTTNPIKIWFITELTKANSLKAELHTLCNNHCIVYTKSRSISPSNMVANNAHTINQKKNPYHLANITRSNVCDHAVEQAALDVVLSALENFS
jgi:hypothetical protein